MLELAAFFMRTETELVLKSRRVVPGRLLEAGFTFAAPGVAGGRAGARGTAAIAASRLTARTSPGSRSIPTRRTSFNGRSSGAKKSS